MRSTAESRDISVLVIFPLSALLGKPFPFHLLICYDFGNIYISYLLFLRSRNRYVLSNPRSASKPYIIACSHRSICLVSQLSPKPT